MHTGWLRIRTGIRRIAVRETSVSRHNGGRIRAPLKLLNNSAAMYGRFQGGSQLGPHDPKKRLIGVVFPV